MSTSVEGLTLREYSSLSVSIEAVTMTKAREEEVLIEQESYRYLQIPCPNGYGLDARRKILRLV